MGQPVVHFEIMGQDGEALKRYYGELFGWEIDSNNPMNYGIIDRERNLNADGIGIGGGIGQMPEGMGAYACALGGPDRRTLFMLAADWRGIEQVDEAIADRTGQVLVAEAPSPGVGWP